MSLKLPPLFQMYSNILRKLPVEFFTQSVYAVFKASW